MTKSRNIFDSLTKTKELYENFFQYASVSLNELINKNSFSFGKNISIDLWKLFVTVNAVGVPGISLYIVWFVHRLLMIAGCTAVT